MAILAKIQALQILLPGLRTRRGPRSGAAAARSDPSRRCQACRAAFRSPRWRAVRLAVPRAAAVTGEVVISPPVQHVYAFYRDFANLPRFLGDVVAVEHVDDRSYRWVVAG